MTPLTGASLVLAGAVLEGVAQVCLKRSAARHRTHLGWLAGGVALFLVEMAFYTRALRVLPVSVAYPLSALSYAAVVVTARLLLGERPDRRRWWGVLLIVAGAACALPD